MTSAAATQGGWKQALRAAPLPRRPLVAMWCLTGASSLLALLQPWPLQVVVDSVLSGNAPAWIEQVRAVLPGAGPALGLAVWAGIAAVLIFLIDALVDVQLTMRWVRVGQGAVYRLGQAVFGRLLRRSPVFHARTPVGDSVGRVTGDSWCVYNAASALLFAPMQALLVGVGSAVVMVRLNAWLAAIALLSTPAVVWLSLWLGRKAQEAKGAERRSEARLESHVHQTFAGLSVVQAFAQEQREQATFGSLTSETLAAQRRSALLGATAGAGASLVASIAMAGVLLLGSREVLAGRLTVGTLLVFVAYQTTLNGQLSSLASAWMSAKGMTASASRVGEVLSRDPEVKSGRSEVPLTDARVGVELESVCFAYEPGRPVLEGFSLHIAPGETIAVVGPSGAGKSTLAMLVARLIDPTEGVVRIGGVDAREATLESVRSRVSVLFQDPALLAGTVAENIRLGKPDATEAEIEQAARSAGAHEFIMRLPAKYRTELGMRGMTLSGGERQRLALARALIRQSPVLVLDEPTASLDAATERALLATLERAAQGRTTLMIAHRLSTIRAADRIAVMDQGRVQELGTHEELLARPGLYARMWALQHGGVAVGGGA